MKNENEANYQQQVQDYQTQVVEAKQKKDAADKHLLNARENFMDRLTREVIVGGHTDIAQTSGAAQTARQDADIDEPTP